MNAGASKAAAGLRDAAAILLLLAAAFTLITFARTPRPRAFHEDEGDYLRAAAHLVRDGVFSHAPLARADPAPDAYREPGYALLVAAAWSLGRCEAPAREDELTRALGPANCAARAVRRLNLLLLGATMLGAAVAVRAVDPEGRVAALAAAAVVGASPELRHSALAAASENLAAPLLVWVCALGALLVRRNMRPRRSLLLATALLAGLAPLVRVSLLALPLTLAALLVIVPGAGETRAGARRRAALFLFVSLLPTLAWLARNELRTGHAVLASSRAVPLIRAELDRQVGREGALAAAAFWTPIRAVTSLAERRWPEATFDRYVWTGDGNFFTRAMRRWRAERAAAADSGAVDRELVREALGDFVRLPFEHATTTLAVAWRGLFAERSPETLHPVDLRFALGIGLALAYATALARALARRDGALVAFLIPALVLFLAHALLTENLPRFTTPLLPVLWCAAILALRRCPPTALSSPASRS